MAACALLQGVRHHSAAASSSAPPQRPQFEQLVQSPLVLASAALEAFARGK